jgi:alkylation response protein AidB-like acyl-CoA dehydrogenase
MLSRFALSSRQIALVARRSFSSTTEVNTKTFNLFNPTEEHASLRQMLRSFVESEVDPQAKEFNRIEKFNVELFRKLGNLGLLGITVDPEYGGSGMDATAAVIAHGKRLSSMNARLLSLSPPSIK